MCGLLMGVVGVVRISRFVRFMRRPCDQPSGPGLHLDVDQSAVVVQKRYHIDEVVAADAELRREGFRLALLGCELESFVRFEQLMRFHLVTRVGGIEATGLGGCSMEFGLRRARGDAGHGEANDRGATDDGERGHDDEAPSEHRPPSSLWCLNAN